MPPLSPRTNLKKLPPDLLARLIAILDAATPLQSRELQGKREVMAERLRARANVEQTRDESRKGGGIR